MILLQKCSRSEPEILQPEAELLHGVLTDQDHILPGNLRYRVGHLLQPTIVAVAPVIHAIVTMENDLEILAGNRGTFGRALERFGAGLLVDRGVERLRSGILQEPIMEQLFPGVLRKISDQRLERLADDIMGRSDRRSGNSRQNLQFSEASVERLDQRLNRHVRAIAGPGISP